MFEYKVEREKSSGIYDTDYMLSITTPNNMIFPNTYGESYNMNELTMDNLKQEIILNYEDKTLIELKKQGKTNIIGFWGKANQLKNMEMLKDIICITLDKIKSEEQEVQLLKELYK